MFKFSEKRKRTVARILCLIVAVAMIASAGFYLVLIFGADSTATQCFAVYGASLEPDSSKQLDRLDILDGLIEYIHGNYKDYVTYEQLVNAAFKGVMDGLEDPWSVYYESEEASSSFVQSVENEYVGIGVTMTNGSEGCYISEVNKNGPAYEVGVRPGCYLTAVDGVSVAGKTLNEISSLVRGKAGTKVNVTFNRSGVLQTFSITRAKIKIATATGELLNNNIGYISITSFASDTATEFKKVRRSLVEQGATSLIIDVRDNGGGYVNTAFEIADELLDSGIISTFQWRGQTISCVEANADNIPNLPIVLLVNEYTASASEIFAAALKENKAATLVGDTTYGKGVAQLIEDVGYGDSIKMSVYYFVTPNGNAIDHVGIAPDYYVETGLYTPAEIASIKATIVPMNEGKKYSAGTYGLTVLGAQQRLALLGYDVNINGYMDAKTVAAIKLFQPKFGGVPYGGLDLSTQKALDQAFNELMTPATEDLQLKKAIELLTK